jgi:hypothetical protein
MNVQVVYQSEDKEMKSRKYALITWFRILIFGLTILILLVIQPSMSKVKAGYVICGVFHIDGNNKLFLTSGTKPYLWQAITWNRDFQPIEVPTDPGIYVVGNMKGPSDYVDIAPIQTRFGTVTQAIVGEHPVWRYNANDALPDFTGTCGNFVVTATLSPTLTPPEIVLTDFTLADTLTSFSNFKTPVVLKPNTLWIQITNIGQSPFYPPGGSGQYVLQVILKQQGGKLEEYDYVSGQPLSLQPLGNFEAGESKTFFVSDLFFWTPADNAEIEVFFAPDESLGMQNSIHSKPVTVQENTDSFQRCVGTIAQVMIKVAKITHPELRAALTYTDLAIKTLQCGTDAKCVAKEDAKWLIGLALGSIKDAGDKDAGELLSLAADAIIAIFEGGPPPCIIVSDWLNAFLHEAIRNKYLVNAIITESPVYPLVTNEAGQQAGFLENGQIVEEIPGSKVVVLGEERYILYPGTDSTQLSIIGYADGKMNLYATFTQSPGQGKSIRFNDIDVTQGMMATLSSSNSQYMLEIDTNSDGNTDQSLPPNEILVVTESGVSQQPIEIPTSIAPTIDSNPPQQPGGICGSAFGLLALPVLAIWRQCKKKKHT